MDIKLWLTTALVDENLAEFSAKIVGSSQKGDGFVAGIVFTEVEGITKDGAPRTYNLVLKCSTNNEAVRNKIPMKLMFENEINFYSKILPEFRKFQEAKGVDNIFPNVPKYYGCFVGDNIEVIVLENVKKAGYDLHNVAEPLSRNHLDLVLEQYAKFHAVSAAFNHQKPREYETLANETINLFKKSDEYMDVAMLFKPPMEQAFNMLKDDWPEDTRNKCSNLIDRIRFVLLDLFENEASFKVVTHGGSWNNNFMFRYEKSESQPEDVIILDWQTTYNYPPVRDVSYFLYASISKEDLEDFDDILKHYYQHFSSYVRELGSDPEEIYTFDQFLKDWDKFSCNGIILAMLIAKIAASKKNEVRDFGDLVDQKKDMTELFQYELGNKNRFKERAKYLIEHAVARQFI